MGSALIVVAGPTASGKSSLALKLARSRAGEIVSCDSLQVYRGFDIGSAKPSLEDRREVPHHLIDVAEPGQEYSAAEYLRQARAAISEITSRGLLPVVAGGTGLYLRALLHGLFEGPARDEALRVRLESTARRFGDGRLWRLLRRVDPATASRLPAADRVRVIRALEVFRLTGRPLSRHLGETERPLSGHRTLTLVLDPGQDALRARVERRTARMLESGLLLEAQRLSSEHPGGLRQLGSIGYRQALQRLAGQLPGEAFSRAIVTATMQYAKRQRTWFRHQVRDAVWCESEEQALAAAVSWLDQEGA